jgi:hypothetical protein
MNDLDGAMVAFLKRCLPRQPVVVTQADEVAIASWMAMTSLLCEHMSSHLHVSPPHHYREMALSHRPPTGTRVWIGVSSEPDWQQYATYRSGFLREMAGNVPLLRRRPDSLKVAFFILGPLVVFLVASTVPFPADADFRGEIGGSLDAVWPTSGQFNWAASAAMSLAQLNGARVSAERFFEQGFPAVP